MAYCSASDIFGFSKNLAHGEPAFTEETDPSITEIQRYMTSGCATIHTTLSARGWTIPVTFGTELYDRLTDLNAMFAAGRAELSRVNATVSPGERTRGQIFLDLFKTELAELADSDLTTIGGELQTNDAEIYVGGVSQSDKLSYYEDTDRETTRFKKNQFKFDDSNYPE